VKYAGLGVVIVSGIIKITVFMLYFATWAGILVSTTHTITGSSIGSAPRAACTPQNGAWRVVWAWILTLPCSALIAMFCEALFSFIGWR